jgi:hypothetical protein
LEKFEIKKKLIFGKNLKFRKFQFREKFEIRKNLKFEKNLKFKKKFEKELKPDENRWSGATFMQNG